MKLLMIFILSVTLGNHAFALSEGGNVGNGGGGVLIGGRYYLLDLVEAGIEQNVDLDLQKYETLIKSWNNDNTREVRKVFYNLTLDGPLADQKVSEGVLALLLRFRPMEALAIIGGIQTYSWNMVNFELQSLDNENSSLDLKKLQMVQIAIRRDRSILINKAIYDEMDTANRVALIFHEILYAFLIPEVRDNFEFQNSWQARQVVGALFAKLTSQPDLFSLDDYNVDQKSIFTFGALVNQYQESPVRGFSEIDSASQVLNFNIEFDPRLSLSSDKNLNLIHVYSSDLLIGELMKRSVQFCQSPIFPMNIFNFTLNRMFDRVVVELKSYQTTTGVSQGLILSPQIAIKSDPNGIQTNVKVNLDQDCECTLSQAISNEQLRFNNQFRLY